MAVMEGGSELEVLLKRLREKEGVVQMAHKAHAAAEERARLSEQGAKAAHAAVESLRAPNERAISARWEKLRASTPVYRVRFNEAASLVYSAVLYEDARDYTRQGDCRYSLSS